MSEVRTKTRPFLAELAGVLLQHHGDSLRDLAIVLPNQRAGLFLRNEMVRQAGKAIWSPDVLTMDRLMSRISGMRSMDEDRLLLELFKVYKTIELDQHDAFHDFMGWGSIALKHFNEVDAYLINREHFYNDIQSFEEIENWSLRESDELSAGQETLIERWHLHGQLHEALIEHLSKNQLGTAGMIERKCVDLLKEGVGKLPWKHVCFAGLNALTAAEVRVMELLNKSGRASFAWESDVHFYEDPSHSAGLSLRKHVSNWGKGLIEQRNDLREKERSVSIAEVPSRIGMVRYAVQHLLEMQKNDPELLKRTTLVLTDTELITPLLEALPESIGAVNVTMSVPLKKIPLTGALNACIELNTRIQEKGRAPVQELVDLLNNAVIAKFVNRTAQDKKVEEWRKSKLTVISKNEIGDFLTNELGEIGHSLNNSLKANQADKLVSSMQSLLDAIKGEEGELLNEQAYQISHTLKTLHDIVSVLPEEEREMRSIVKLWRKLVNNAAVGLYGEPLQGLQVMGLLETRAIPLENVIMFPANEGFLPPSAFERSFIPFDVRRAFELPMRSDADAVITYHFYRALASSTSMMLLVDTSESLEPQEPSRFIDQLLFELNAERGQSNTRIDRFAVQAPNIDRNHPIYEVPRSEAVVNGIKAKLKKGLSPSALNTYLQCPLDFYFKYVLGLKSDEIVPNDIGADVIGNIVHKVIEECYKPPREVNAEYLNRFIDELDPYFESAVEFNKAKGFLDHPRNRFPMFMAKESIRTLLKQEIAFLKQGGTLKVLETEQWISASTQTDHAVPYTIGGFADRIEIRDGNLRVVDLKTGSVDERDLQVKDLSYEELLKKPKAVQLLCYAWIHLKNNPDVDALNATILSARLSSTFPGMSLKIGGSEYIRQTMLPQIESFFETVIAEMLDTESALSHSADSKYCGFCIEQNTVVSEA